MSAVLEGLERLAAERPRAATVTGAERALTAAELLAEVRAAAAELSACGTRVLGLAAGNGPAWAVIDLAAQLAGVVLVPLPTFFSRSQVEHVLADCNADCVLADKGGLELLARSSSERIRDMTLVRLGAGAAGTASELPSGTAKISYTSGTTGRPKGVCLTQEVMDRVARSLVTATATLAIDRHLCVLPFAVLLENVAGLYAPLLDGAEVVAPAPTETGFDGAMRFDPERLLTAVEQREAQSLILLPQLLAAVLPLLEAGRPAPPRLRFVAVGGGRTAPSLLVRARRVGLPVYEGYGLTECASVVALSTPEASRRGSVGRPLAHAGVRIGRRSEILVSGASIAGYVGGSPASTPEIATGDVGHLDPDGFLYIDGRLKNVFITSFGRNVSPEWVEAELTARDSIAQAALFGEARPWNTAVIVPAAGADAKRIQCDIDAVNAGLPDYARVVRWLTARQPFTFADGLLTRNGRNRREAIWRRYAEAVGAGYDPDGCSAAMRLCTSTTED